MLRLGRPPMPSRVPLPATRAARPAVGMSLPAVLRVLERAALGRVADGLLLDRETRAADPARIARLVGLAASQPPTLDLALDHAVRDAAHQALSHGWRVTELLRFARRRFDEQTVGYLADVLGLAAQWSAAHEWLAELDADGSAPWWTAAAPHATQWRERAGVDQPRALAVAVDVLALLVHLPHTETARLGTPAASGAEPGVLVTESRIARRIDALFAKAVGTTNAHEAEAYAAKAQDLLLRYARSALVRPVLYRAAVDRIAS